MSRFAAAVALSLILAVPGCGSSPADALAPSSSIPSFGGVWALEWRLDTCDGARHCGLLRGTGNSTLVRLTQVGEHVEGVLEVGYGVPVTGTISAGNKVVLTGNAPAAGSLDSIGAIDAVVTLETNREHGLIGSLRYDSRPTYNPEVSGVYIRGGEVLRATRSASAPSVLSGNWRGRYIVRRCVPVGWPTCAAHLPDSIGLYEMTLVQSGRDVSGAFTLYNDRDFYSLQGAVDGGTLILTAPPNRRVVSGGLSELRLLKWAGTPDSFGRMMGSFTFVDEYQQTSGGVLSYTVDADLLGVTRLP